MISERQKRRGIGKWSIVSGVVAIALWGVVGAATIPEYREERDLIGPMMLVGVVTADNANVKAPWVLKLAAKIKIREAIIAEIPLDAGDFELKSVEGKWVEIIGTLSIGAASDLVFIIHVLQPQ